MFWFAERWGPVPQIKKRERDQTDDEGDFLVEEEIYRRREKLREKKGTERRKNVLNWSSGEANERG